jgi:ATP synthase protein I
VPGALSDCRRLGYGKVKATARVVPPDRDAAVRSTHGNKVIATTAPNPRRLAYSVVLGQAGVTVACALVSLWIADSRAAVSALLGGGISAIATLAMALVSFGQTAAMDPQRAVRAFLLGETAKVAVVIVLFVVVLKTMKVVPLAMLGSYIATFVVFWVALAQGLPADSGSAGTKGPGEGMRL